jgi:hypothetical protein
VKIKNKKKANRRKEEDILKIPLKQEGKEGEKNNLLNPFIQHY